MYVSDLRHPSPTLEEKLHHLYGLRSDKNIDMGFRQPFLDLLEAFGNPQHKLPPVIHVAGTNGKGSTVATLRAILEAAGYKVHAYTSPHLIKFNERICLAGKDITDDMLEDLIDEALALNKNQIVSFFEVTTSMTFAAFARVPANVVLLETGLGGRLDCSNIIDRPAASVITSISRDHQELLGDTLQKIAAEKAGIIKTGSPCILASQPFAEEVTPVFIDEAKRKNAQLYAAGAEWFTEDRGGRMRFVFKDEEYILPLPNLPGKHQIQNAGTALAALRVIRGQFEIPETAMERGLQNIHWPARMQKLDEKKFGLPESWELWLDGGHNEDGGRILAQQAKDWKQQNGRPLYLVMGMVNRKDPLEFAAPIAPFTSSITTLKIPEEPKSFSAAELEKLLETLPAAVKQAANVQTAIQDIALREKPGRILIAGSLYLAGQVLKACS